MPRLVPLLAVLLAAPAEATPIEHAARLTLGPVWDGNPSRETGPTTTGAAGMAAVLSLDVSQRDDSHATLFSLDTGARGFTGSPKATDNSELATVLSLSHSFLFDGAAPFLAFSGKDLRARKAGLFDYSDGALRAGVALGPSGRLTPRLYGGVELFQYRPDQGRYDFSAVLGGASLHADLGRGHTLDASWDGSFRNYRSEQHAAQIASIDWSYRGPVILGAGYQIVLSKNDPVLGTHRNRLQARAGVPLPGRLLLTVDAALFLGNTASTNAELQNVEAAIDDMSSLGAQLALPLGGAVSLQGSFRWYASVGQPAPYDRKLAGVSAAIDF